MAAGLVETVVLLTVLMFAFARRLSARGALSVLLFAAEDDDIKIAPDSFAPRPPREENDRILSAYIEEKRNGNLNKAKILGKRFAQIVSDISFKDFPELKDADGDTLRHAVILNAFTVNSSFENLIPNQISAQVAVNTFLEELEFFHPKLWEDINETGAFSLYLLALRAGEDVKEAVGTRFSELVKNGYDAETAALGSELYERFYRFCGKAVSAMLFK